MIRLCGDGCFDSRGYSALWCKYFVLDAETGQVLEYIAAHKTETGSSGKVEVCNEAAQRVVAVKY